MLIELSHRIRHDLPVFPGDDATTLNHTRQYANEHYNNHQLSINMHAGTHIDGPMHLTESQVYLSEFPLDTFVGNGCVINAEGDDVIDYKAEYESLIQERDIVIVHTGHSDMFGQPSYFTSYPAVMPAFAELLVRKKVKLLGLDTPSPDYEPFAIHKRLLGNRILIAENLTGVRQLLHVGAFEVIALPLHIEADSSIARIIARVIDKR
ncbi:kynurenine formamidase [Paenibacillus phyllosphaerae]|uniref:Kynurenine formamidase n=1 Tax=Paenibacillus phyllosphaerae TaxID=274593 RepID=A0A7W5FR14_9BACL|nr:cyclase family protein [Paenibacillus phyllosphaerae]MBB3113878.1 kynurenine formamidase [Paenibacillus phyllosphaerae]